MRVFRGTGYEGILGYEGIPGYEGEGIPGYGVRVDSRVRGYSGVRGYSIWGTRVFDMEYEGIRYGVRGHRCQGTRVLVPMYEGI